MKSLALLHILVAVTVFVACDHAQERRREQFVRAFVESAREDSEYFKRYISAEDLELIATARPMLTSDFEIVHRDEYGGQAFEYGVKFANGATAIVAIQETAGEVRHATLVVNERPAP